MVSVAQLVRASDCGSEGRGFEPHYSPQKLYFGTAFFCLVALTEKLSHKQMRSAHAKALLPPFISINFYYVKKSSPIIHPKSCTKVQLFLFNDSYKFLSFTQKNILGFSIKQISPIGPIRLISQIFFISHEHFSHYNC